MCVCVGGYLRSVPRCRGGPESGGRLGEIGKCGDKLSKLTGKKPKRKMKKRKIIWLESISLGKLIMVYFHAMHSAFISFCQKVGVR